MKKVFYLAFFVFFFSNTGQSAVLISPSKSLSQAYKEISPKELSRISLGRFEDEVGRKLNKEEIVEFRQEKRKARKAIRKPLFGKEGSFPWWSLILAVLSIVVLIVVVI